MIAGRAGKRSVQVAAKLRQLRRREAQPPPPLLALTQQGELLEVASVTARVQRKRLLKGKARIAVVQQKFLGLETADATPRRCPVRLRRPDAGRPALGLGR